MGEGGLGGCLMGIEFSVLRDERVLDIGSTIMWIYLTLLRCILRKSNDKFCYFFYQMLKRDYTSMPKLSHSQGPVYNLCFKHLHLFSPVLFLTQE